MKTACIYHSIDLDGWMSAAIVRYWFEKTYKHRGITDSQTVVINPKLLPEDYELLVLIGYNYGNPIPDLSEYDRVIMCDISFPKEEMLKLFDTFKENLIVIDHHISFIDSCKPYTSNKISNYIKTIENKKEQEIKYVDNEWRSIADYEDFYEVSNNGQVRSLDRIIEASDKKIYNRKGKILKPYFSKRGYYVVNLPKGQVGIHKLVAEAFINNPEELPCVNHIDGNTKNNVITNLEWCDYSKNNQHALDNNMRIPNNKAVVKLDLEDNYIEWYYSLADAEVENGIAWTNISSVCRENGNSKTAGGFKWQFVEDYNNNKFEGLRNTKFAACELTWLYFMTDQNKLHFDDEDVKNMPEIIRLLGMYDSFRHKTKSFEMTSEGCIKAKEYFEHVIHFGPAGVVNKLEEFENNNTSTDGYSLVHYANNVAKRLSEEQKVLEFQYGARQCISNYEEAYDYLIRSKDDKLYQSGQYFDNVINQIYDSGKAIYKYLCTDAKQAYKNGFEISLSYGKTRAIGYSEMKKDFKFICINKERFNPINFGIDYHKDGYDGCACFYRRADGKWSFSLYNDNGKVDCSIIAKQFSGGGHFSASGFVCDNETFLKIING